MGFDGYCHQERLFDIAVRRHSSNPGQTNGQMDVFVSMFGCSSNDARSG